MTKIHVMVYKAYVQKNSFMHVDVKFMFETKFQLRMPFWPKT